MTQLRKRMIEDLQLRGFAPKTQEAYLRAVRQLAEHFDKSPADLTEEDLREYFLHLKNVRQASRSTCTQALCGIKFLFRAHAEKRLEDLRIGEAAQGKEAAGGFEPGGSRPRADLS